MIDTHIHLDFESYDNDREEVIKRFFDDGGKALVNIGVDKKTIKRTLDLAEKYENIYAAVGFHPEEGEKLLKENENYDFIEELKSALKNEKVKAIGEIGLEYYYIPKDAVERVGVIERQKKLFVPQLELAAEPDLPVVIHCRDAYEDLFSILSQKSEILNLKKVIHCYGGNIDETKKLMELPNCFFSFTGNITYGKAKNDVKPEIYQVIKMVPIERIMVETDGPFLSPVPERGKRNEPSYVRHVIEKIAEIKEMDSREVEEITDKNAIEFFNLK